MMINTSFHTGALSPDIKEYKRREETDPSRAAAVTNDDRSAPETSFCFCACAADPSFSGNMETIPDQETIAIQWNPFLIDGVELCALRLCANLNCFKQNSYLLQAFEKKRWPFACRNFLRLSCSETGRARRWSWCGFCVLISHCDTNTGDFS